jgi:hypothetical protein
LFGEGKRERGALFTFVFIGQAFDFREPASDFINIRGSGVALELELEVQESISISDRGSSEGGKSQKADDKESLHLQNQQQAELWE